MSRHPKEESQQEEKNRRCNMILIHAEKVSERIRTKQLLK
jgi:hypothetical protein